jgi:predicted dehydrogenase
VRKIKAAVVGLGHWGPTLARNLAASADFALDGVCDRDPARLAPFASLKTFTAAGAMLRALEPELVAVCTPVSTHFAIVKELLEGGADVLCEKPLAASAKEAADLVELAHRCGRRLFVNHMCANAPAVKRLRETYVRGELGELRHVEAVRMNRGRVQSDIDVVGDLAPHDLAIIEAISGRSIEAVTARGSAHAAQVDLEYAGGLTACLQLSWISPVKVRRMDLRGSTSSVVYEEAGSDALAAELVEVARAIRGEPAEVSTGEAGLAMLRVLEAGRMSLRRDGARVAL